ncbi:hypothetical protein AAG906_025617 [Vitis piasezkii]
MRLFLSLSVIRGLVQATFNVEENIAKGLWTHTTPSQDGKGKKAIRSPRNSRKVESFVQLAWVHHFITIQFKALSSLTMVIIRDIIFIFVESSPRLVL